MEQLSRALRHTHNAISVKIKLIKSNGAYLTIDVVQVDYKKFVFLLLTY